MPSYMVAQLDDLETIACPCGLTRRAFVDDEEQRASLHLLDVKKDAQVHYHKRLTEIYFILEGEGYMELDGDMVPVKPMTGVLIKPGCRHRAVGDLRVAIIAIPAFDPDDEYIDG